MDFNCPYCGSHTFSEQASFKGTTKRYASDYFDYCRCSSCGSLINIASQKIDYQDYITGNKVSSIKAQRLVNFLKQNGLSGEFLDYGCGRGALLKALRQRGFCVDGYEPFNPELADIPDKTYSLIYLTHVFEHIDNYDLFFKTIKQHTVLGSRILTIHPSSTRIKKLNPADPFQVYTIHAPFHLAIPSDRATLKLFQNHGFQLEKNFPYDLQRSGWKDNNRVSALLTRNLGGLKENVITASFTKKLAAALKSPRELFNGLFINTTDYYVSTFLFKRI